MHNLNLTALFPEPPPDRMRGTYKSSACTDAERVFSDNLGVVESLSMVPGVAFMTGEDWGHALSDAMREKNCTDSQRSDVQQKAEENWNYRDARDWEERRKEFLGGVALTEKAACMNGREYGRKALHSLLRSLITQSWSAYELLAEMLIIGCKEKHPTLFSNGILAKRHSVRNGTALPKSFEDVFSDNQISAAAWSSDIKGHALLRHLLIHLQGKVDKSHVDQRQSAPAVTEWDAYKEGDEILLDGELVRRLIDRTTRGGYALLDAVSNWVNART